ncbi:Lsr2 protein [Amycolatopsis pretoriensis]|uniref:Lsr2 protein n=1 Tax=Amycolatopsis pretoriensis TaxID=218821 RepID=A0A1H5RAP7_9PSEU|nr:histone-like nucleoid-structuring protein Lsr2 [Amycolatopsis pretoriensis]SEF34477.1 Lsr2 protein [Amycolatopsis pretoriensis]
MAQRITIVDDVDLETVAVGSVEFGFRVNGAAGTRAARQEYVIDLGPERLEELTAVLTEWASHARKADKGQAVIRAPIPPPVVADQSEVTHEWFTPPEVHSTRERERWTLMRKDARAWALVNGWPGLGDRGRVPDHAYVAWKKTMGWTGPLFEEWSAWRDARDKDSPPKRKQPRAKATKSTQDTLM